MKDVPPVGPSRRCRSVVSLISRFLIATPIALAFAVASIAVSVSLDQAAAGHFVPAAEASHIAPSRGDGQFCVGAGCWVDIVHPSRDTASDWFDLVIVPSDSRFSLGVSGVGHKVNGPTVWGFPINYACGAHANGFRCWGLTPDGISTQHDFSVRGPCGSTVDIQVHFAEVRDQPPAVDRNNFINLVIKAHTPACPTAPKIEVTKTAPATTIAGQQVTYDFKVTNAGNGVAKNVKLHDFNIDGDAKRIPLVFPFAGSSGAQCAPQPDNSILCPLGDIGVNETRNISLTFNTTANQKCGQTVMDQVDVWPENGGQNWAKAMTRIECPNADVIVTKTGPSTILRDRVLFYTVTAKNQGTATSEHVVVSDRIPVGLTFNKNSSSESCVLNGQGTSVLCNDFDLVPNESKTFTIAFNLPNNPNVCGTTITNQAAVSSASPDANANNNVSSIVSTSVNCNACQDGIDNDDDGSIDFPNDPGCDEPEDDNEDNPGRDTADLRLVKRKIGENSARRGELIYYELIVTNDGPSTASDVLVGDQIPSGLSFLPEASDDGCFVDDGTVFCDGIDIPSGQSHTFTIGFKVGTAANLCGSIIVNKAATASDVDDPNLNNNRATLNTPIRCFECSDDVDNDNDGNVDKRDAGCHSDNNPNNDNSYNPNDDDETDEQRPQCSDGIDNDGDGKIDHPNDPGCDSPNDNDESNGPAKLDVEKYAPEITIAGELTTYRFTVKNTGGKVAKSVTLGDFNRNDQGKINLVFPFVSSTGANCSFIADNQSIKCNLGDIQPGEEREIFMTFRAPANKFCDKQIMNQTDVNISGTTSGSDWDKAMTTVRCQPPAPQCRDGKDNDGDGKIDFPNDPGCDDAEDNNETDETCDLDDVSVRANFLEVENKSTKANAQPKIILSNGAQYGQNQSFPVLANGVPVSGSSTNANVPGVFVEPLENAFRVTFYCKQESKDFEKVYLELTLSDGAKFVGVQNDKNRPFENFGNGKHGITNTSPPFGHDDEVVLGTGTNRAVLFSGCSTHIDTVTLYYTRDEDRCVDVPECRDGLDNDGDGKVDFPNDPGCDSRDDDSEFNVVPECSDNQDNDEDGRVDAEDPGCHSDFDPNDGDNTYNPNDDDESDEPQCADGVDNDNDGKIDFPNDPGCDNPGDDDEKENIDLSISKTGPTSNLKSQSVLYTITVKNDGTATAKNVVVSDEIPGGLIFNAQKSGGNGVTCVKNNNDVLCDSFSLNGGQQKTFTIAFDIKQDTVACGFVIKNKASVSSSSTDTDDSDNTSQLVSTSVECNECQDGVDNDDDDKIDFPNDPGCDNPEDDDEDNPDREHADLRLIKRKTGVNSATRGEIIVYELVATNDGPATTNDVLVGDQIPSGLTFVEAQSDDDCFVDDDTVFCDGIDIPSGGSHTFHIAFKVGTAANLCGSTIVNRAAVASDVSDPNLNNNRASLNTPINCVECSDGVDNDDDGKIDFPNDLGCTGPDDGDEGNDADLSIVKTGPAQILKSGVLKYTIKVKNEGGTTAPTVVVTDEIPAGLAFNAQQSGGNGATCVKTGNIVVCDGFSLNAGESKTFTIAFTILENMACNATVKNTARVSSAAITDPNPANNTSQVVSTTVECNECQDKVDNDNDGKIDFPNDPGCDNPEDDDEDNPDKETADLRLVKKKTGNNSAVRGETIVYELVVTNGGPAKAVDILVGDEVPSGLTFVPAQSDANCALDDDTVFCDGIDLESGESHTFKLAFKVGTAASLCGSTIVNRAAVASDVSDPNLNNNRATLNTPINCFECSDGVDNDGDGKTDHPADLGCDSPNDDNEGDDPQCSDGDDNDGDGKIDFPNDPGCDNPGDDDEFNEDPKADLSLVKTGPAAAKKGDTVIYKLKVSNAGPNTATNVAVEDPIPAGLTFENAGSDDDCVIEQDDVILCDGLTLPKGQSHTFTITLKIKSDAACGSSYKNRATVVALQNDPNLANNKSEVTTSITCAECSDGQDNDGDGAIDDDDYSCSGPDDDDETFPEPQCDDDLDNDGDGKIDFPNDPGCDDNQDNDEKNPEQDKADLSIVKTGPATAKKGQVVTYKLKVTNSGPATATGIAAEDPIPAGLTFVNAGSDDDCVVEQDGVVLCNELTLAKGQSHTYTISFKVSDTAACGSSFKNRATVVALQNDPNLANNKSEVATTVSCTECSDGVDNDNDGAIDEDDYSCSGPDDDDETFPEPQCNDGLDNDGDGKIDFPNDPGCDDNQDNDEKNPVQDKADLSLVKTGPATAKKGQVISYQLKVSNSGPNTATSVAVEDPIPAGLTFVEESSDDDCVVEQDGVILCDGLTLPKGQSHTYTIAFKVSTTAACGSSFKNRATAVALQNDPNLANNKSEVATSVSCTECSDGVDNDDDGAIDDDDFSCSDPEDDDEHFPEPQCDDGLDNDGDGKIDFPNDPGCDDNQDNDEKNPVQDKADLSLVKSGPATAKRGDTVIYKLKVSNAGPSTATSVAVEDPIPTGLTFVEESSDDDCVVEQDGVILCNGLTLPKGQSHTYTIALKVKANAPCGSSYKNRAAVVALQNDPNLANNKSEVTTSIVCAECSDGEDNDGDGAIDTQDFSCSGPDDDDETFPEPQCDDGLDNDGDGKVDFPNDPGCDDDQDNDEKNPVQDKADLSIVKTGPSTAKKGQTITYQLKVSNSGPSTATSVAAEDPIPAGLTFVEEGSDDDCVIEQDGVILCDGLTLPKGQSHTYTIALKVGDTAACGSSFKNRATVVALQNDPNLANNKSEVTTSIVCTECSDNVDNDNDGAIDEDDYSCSGPDDDDETFPEPQCDDGLDNDGDGKVDFPNDPGCDDNQDNDEKNPVQEKADLSLVKTGPATAKKGETVTYKLKVSNAGPSTATSVAVEDPIPTGLTFVEESSDDDCVVEQDGVILCDGLTLPKGQSHTYTVVFKVEDNAVCDSSFKNRATVVALQNDPNLGNNSSQVTTSISCTECADGEDNDGDGVIDEDDFSCDGPEDDDETFPEPQCNDGLDNDGDGKVDFPNDPGCENNQDNDEKNAVQDKADIRLVKTGPASIKKGQTISYQLKVSNSGPSTATNVAVEDPIPAGLTFVAESSDDDCVVEQDGVILCNGLTLPKGQSHTYTVSFKVGDAAACGSSFKNRATAVALQNDPNLANNASEVTTSIACTECSDGVDNDNDGSIDEDDFSCETPEDDDETFPEPQCNDGLDNDGDGKVDFPNDPGCENNQDNDEKNAVQDKADIRLIKSGPATAKKGQIISFQLKVSNSGPNTATNVAVEDPIPAGLTFVAESSDDDCVVEQDGVILCNGLTLPKGQSHTYTVSFKIGDSVACGSTYKNRATAVALQNDPNLANNVSEVTTSITCTECSDGVDNDNDGAIDEDDYSCSGPDDDDETFPEPQCNDGLDNDGDGKVDFPNDPGCDDNQDNDETNAVQEKADLRLVKTGPATGKKGDTLVYKLKVSNSGPSTATSVAVEDPIPAGLTFVDEGSDDDCVIENDGVVLCNSLTLPKGQSHTYTVAFKVKADAACGSTYKNKATVVALQNDPNLANNVSEVTTTINCTECSDDVDNDNDGAVDLNDFSCSGPDDDDETFPEPACNDGLDNDGDGKIDFPNDPGCENKQDNDETNAVQEKADLSLIKTGPATGKKGDTLVYKLKVSNAGPSSATSVAVEDPIPAGLTFVNEGSDDDCVVEQDGVVLCNGLTLAKGQSHTYTVAFKVKTDAACGSTYKNKATAVAFQNDPNLANNVSEVTTTINCTQCSDGVDNDNDGKIDLDDFSCSSPEDDDETFPEPACNDGLDNDGDGKIDFPNDPGCETNQDNDETNAVQEKADLSLIKTGPATGKKGQVISYKLKVSNGGPSTATSVAVQDPIPSGLTFDDAGSDDDCVVEQDGVILCNGLTLPKGQSHTYTVAFKVKADAACGAVYKNKATAVAFQNDPNLANNVSEVTTTINCTQCSDGVDNDNDGATDLNDFSCSGPDDDDETFPEPACNDGLDNDGDGKIDFPNDPGCDNKQDNDETNAVQEKADLSLIKTGPSTAKKGQVVTYQLKVSNAGPNTATSVAVEDPIPAGLTFDDAGSDDDCVVEQDGVVLCDGLSLLKGESHTYSVSFKVKADAACGAVYKNKATAVAFQNDPNLANNVSEVTTTVTCTQCSDGVDNDNDGATDLNDFSCSGPDDDDEKFPEPACNDGLDNDTDGKKDFPNDPGCDSNQDNDEKDPATTLSIEKNGPATINAGDKITYTVTIKNTGTVNATGVKITDNVPAGLIPVTGEGSAECALNGNSSSFVCSLASLDKQQSKTFTLVFEHEGSCGETIKNIAVASAANAESKQGEALTTVNACPKHADLKMTKSGPSSVEIGHKVVYELKVENLGPDAAQDIEIEDLLPDGTTFVSAESSDVCQLEGSDVTCSIESLDKGLIKTLTITATVGEHEELCGKSILNKASVQAETDDPNEQNNLDDALTAVTCPEPEFPSCQGEDATIYVDEHGKIVGGYNHGDQYEGVLEGTAGRDVIVGTDEDDIISGYSENDIICGGGGNDAIDAGSGHDIVEGNEGDDEIDGSSGNDWIDAGEGKDWVKGSSGDDDIFGDEGKDTIYGDSGWDVICSEGDDDEIDGGSGNDKIAGGDGVDTIEDPSGNEYIDGGLKTDLVDAGIGIDFCSPGDTSANCEVIQQVHIAECDREQSAARIQSKLDSFSTLDTDHGDEENIEEESATEIFSTFRAIDEGSVTTETVTTEDVSVEIETDETATEEKKDEEPVADETADTDFVTPTEEENVDVDPDTIDTTDVKPEPTETEETTDTDASEETKPVEEVSVTEEAPAATTDDAATTQDKADESAPELVYTISTEPTTQNEETVTPEVTDATTTAETTTTTDSTPAATQTQESTTATVTTPTTTEPVQRVITKKKKKRPAAQIVAPVLEDIQYTTTGVPEQLREVPVLEEETQDTAAIEQLRQDVLAEDGLPTSSDPVWDACVRFQIVFDMSGKPYTCRHDDGVFTHPDHPELTFTVEDLLGRVR